MAANKLTSLSPSDLVAVLKQAGCRTVSEETIKRDLQAGAPTNEDGTINFLHYTAWLIKESNNGN